MLQSQYIMNCWLIIGFSNLKRFPTIKEILLRHEIYIYFL